MNRDLERRLAALEAARSSRGVLYVVRATPSDYDDEEEVAPYRPMTEAEWVAIYCGTGDPR